MKVNYILEMVTLNEWSDTLNWRWKQVAIGEDIQDLKRLCGNRHRILDAHTLEEVYRTAPSCHSQLLDLAMGY